MVHGDQDRIVPAENGRALAARIPGAQFRLVREAGHILITDQPEICAEVVLGFLGAQMNRAGGYGRGRPLPCFR